MQSEVSEVTDFGEGSTASFLVVGGEIGGVMLGSHFGRLGFFEQWSGKCLLIEAGNIIRSSLGSLFISCLVWVSHIHVPST